MSIHNYIKQRRLELGLTPRQLAERVGVTRAAVQQWERNTAPSRKHRAKVIKALEVKAAEYAAFEAGVTGFEVSDGVLSFTIPPRLKLGDVKEGMPHESFTVEMPDQALQHTTPQGTVLLCSTAAQPSYGKGVVVRDAAGRLHVRRYSQGAAGGWEAAADTPGFATLSQANGARIVAAVIGRFDGSV